MHVTMEILTRENRLLCVLILLLGAAGSAGAQDIYKCTKNGQVAYTDRPCPGGKGELLHQADDSEIIDQYLDLGQDDVAKRYAVSHNIDSLYKQRLEARKQRMEAKAQQQADEAALERQREEADRQQALIDAAASRSRLQGENDALRQQNAEYLDQLSQPVNNNGGRTTTLALATGAAARLTVVVTAPAQLARPRQHHRPSSTRACQLRAAQ
jgi:hypothetical protein